jgi:SAM-dependent methyltransferase
MPSLETLLPSFGGWTLPSTTKRPVGDCEMDLMQAGDDIDRKESWRSTAIRKLTSALTAEHTQWKRWRAASSVRFGTLRTVSPISRVFGIDRGLPIDRYYIERFLAQHAPDIRGRVLEVADNTYTRRFGGGQVMISDVLFATSGNAKATMVGDLSRGDGLPSDAFDCIILTQTLQFVYDVRAAVRQLYRMLKPDGVLLATVPGISQISRYDMDRWGEFWRFTSLSARRLFEEVSPMGVHVEAHGNVLAAIAFLHGLATEELQADELNAVDPDYELLIAIRAVKTQTGKAC